MSEPSTFADPASFADATELLDVYGDYAAMEASLRARNSREAGNILHFCRWRQAERTIAMLNGGPALGSTH